MTASLTVAPTIGLWKPQFTAELYKQWFSIETHNGIKSLNNPVGTFVWRNNFSLPAGILLDINAVYTTCGHNQMCIRDRKSSLPALLMQIIRASFGLCS